VGGDVWCRIYIWEKVDKFCQRTVVKKGTLPVHMVMISSLEFFLKKTGAQNCLSGRDSMAKRLD
ncbi:hypothetical protein QLX67_06700, partial [Balneolaceae bacterium ANBcel3]|nr:hypothetical protein [Balneolaceae bacterium ANBcel3]